MGFVMWRLDSSKKHSKLQEWRIPNLLTLFAKRNILSDLCKRVRIQETQMFYQEPVSNANVMGRTEFYMVSHKAMKGTARPVRYTVLEDENQYGDKLQKFIYDLCHMYGRCTKSVGVVSPV